MSMRRVIAIAAGCVAIAGMAACGSDGDDADTGASGATSTSTEPVKIGVILKSLQNDYWLLAKSGIDTATDRLGGSAEVEFAAGKDQNDATEQVAQVENMLTRGVKAIAIAPSGADQMTPVLKRAADQGVRVILIDTDLPNLPERSFVGTDNLAGGKAAGEAFLKTLDGKSGKVVVLTALKGVQTVDDREQGFKEALAGSGNTIEETAQTKCDPATAKGIAENVLTKDPNVVGFFSSCGGILAGVIGAATKAVGAEKTRAMTMVEFDFAESLQGKVFASGMLDGAIAQYPQTMGEKATELAAQAAAGKEIPKVVPTKIAVVTPSNYEQYVAEFNTALAKVKE